MKYFLLIFIFAANFLTALEIVVAKHDTRKIFTEIQMLEKTRENYDEEWGRLQLEQSTWAADVKIESIAIQNLQMKTPDVGSIVLIKK